MFSRANRGWILKSGFCSRRSPSHARVAVLEYRAFQALKEYETGTYWATKLSGQRGWEARQEQLRLEQEEAVCRRRAACCGSRFIAVENMPAMRLPFALLLFV
jgi:hypothetical protein